MTTQDLIRLAENKLQVLNQAQLTASINGDLPGIEAADAEIAETQSTLDRLRTL